MDSEIEFLSSDSNVHVSESGEENKMQTNKKYLSVMEATKDIGIFDGKNKEPIVFTEACERAYRQINPRDILNLNQVVRSKIQGEPRKILRIEKDYHHLLLGIKRLFVPAYQMDWMYELVNLKQELYESPIMFGRRLGVIAEYASRGHLYQHSPVLSQDQIDTRRKDSLRLYLEKLSNERLRQELSETNPKTLLEAIRNAKDIWNNLNFKFSLRTNKNNYCPYCKDRDFHYYDCQIE